MRVQSLGQEDLLEEGRATHSTVLVWRIAWTEEAGGLRFTGFQRVRRNSYMPCAMRDVKPVLVFLLWLQEKSHCSLLFRNHEWKHSRAQPYVKGNPQSVWQLPGVRLHLLSPVLFTYLNQSSHGSHHRMEDDYQNREEETQEDSWLPKDPMLVNGSGILQPELKLTLEHFSSKLLNGSSLNFTKSCQLWIQKSS